MEAGSFIDEGGKDFWGVQVFRSAITEYVAASDRYDGLLHLQVHRPKVTQARQARATALGLDASESDVEHGVGSPLGADPSHRYRAFGDVRAKRLRRPYRVIPRGLNTARIVAANNTSRASPACSAGDADRTAPR